MRGPISSSSAAISHSSPSGCKHSQHQWQTAAARYPCSTARRARPGAFKALVCTMAAHLLQGDERLRDWRLQLRRRGRRDILRRLRARAAGTPGQLTCEGQNTLHEPCVTLLPQVPKLAEDKSGAGSSTSSCSWGMCIAVQGCLPSRATRQVKAETTMQARHLQRSFASAAGPSVWGQCHPAAASAAVAGAGAGLLVPAAEAALPALPPHAVHCTISIVRLQAAAAQ